MGMINFLSINMNHSVLIFILALALCLNLGSSLSMSSSLQDHTAQPCQDKFNAFKYWKKASGEFKEIDTFTNAGAYTWKKNTAGQVAEDKFNGAKNALIDCLANM